MAEKTTPCVGYLRVSTTRQTEKFGFKRQYQAIKKYAEQHNFKLVKTYREIYTGTETDRPKFQEMVSELLLNGTRTILIESFDRFSRDVAGGMTLVHYLASKNLNLVNCSNNTNVTHDCFSNPHQRAIVQFMAVVSELERNLTTHRLKKGREAKSKKLGRYCGGPKRTYNNKMRKKIQKLRDRGHTLQAIADKFNREGVKTAKGGEWNTSLIRYVGNDKRRSKR